MEVIRVENLSKLYDLGQVGTGTISKDLNRWWARVRGQEDPYSKIGHVNDRTKKAGKDDSVWALKDIDFSVKQGEVLGIIGRNGAGKSTLLKIISRITTPTTGAVKVKGRIASLLEVGTGFHPEMTGRENIFMNGTLLGMTRREIQSKLDEIIDFAGVAMYIDTPVKRYSSGMQVRLAFAVGAFLEPEILIVDEVLAVGDVEFQKKAIGKMKDVSKKHGRTVLFVSHNLQAVANICSNVILITNGALNFRGAVNDGIQFYLKNENSKELFDVKSALDALLKIKDEVIKFFDLNLYQKGSTGLEFESSQNIVLYLKYRIKIKTNGLRVGFDLHDLNTGVILFRTFHDDMFLNSSFFDENNFITELAIPKNILRSGEYKISLAIGIHNFRWIVHNEIFIKFTVVNLNGINKTYSDNRPGLIMPEILSKTIVVA